MVDVAIVDYGMGNLRSVEQALRHVAPAADIVVTDDASVIAQAGRVVFPGQGAMPDCMRELDARGLRNAVIDAAQTKPFLGICIGLQMLFEHSAEGDVPGLGVLSGDVLRFAGGMQDAEGNKLKVPHMGWNQVRHQTDHPLWNGIAQDARFYYVHSYYVKPQDQSLIQATSDYPVPFVCAVARGNLFGVQFHPEKSQAAGLKLLQNFIHWNP
ncbi:MAG TPA: imidazole glycerol phosphate synthase subunit HisH [Gallionella sp.]|nr:imidazole glycerol phosphate synthase subunit HisH [Gallionella sp.]OGS66234.1 MAG: imidazole glycerol phosphate synthase, glutamine amidotransferase subunit [Gallionellales bacterium GWA2_54_124]OGT20066.1 MAG: imidazole glycerol phosphate synthase, glutamine amidotransferase subunit [Gallionellales bacterium RIFOXYD12_FULL_53_10]OGT29184.1 MAG: imidazole glycerol phosphate synthase, glutamine amidotransferase subunit [Gallionellales bacterium RIFOXYD2_FULL_52_7]HCI52825.1 imidazole glycero